jgi:DNA-binding beta-propeller fold protein YncE
MTWGMAGMDETSLPALLEAAFGDDEPPAGPAGRNWLRESIRMRRQARMRRAAGAAAVIAAAAVAVPTVTGVFGNSAAAPGAGTAYVVIQGSGTVVPIDLATNTPERPIRVGRSLYAIAITPDGKTAYVSDGQIPAMTPQYKEKQAVTPVDLATHTPGRPIRFSTPPFAIAITPDGKTAYVSNGNDAVTPIDLATNTPGKPIHIGHPFAIAITPNGKTAYVAGVDAVTPIDLATNTPGKPIHIGGPGDLMAIAPDGKTAYLASENTVTPIDLATSTPGKPIHVAGSAFAIAINPAGTTAYVTGETAVTPIDLATDTPGKPITVRHASPHGRYISSPGSIAITP